MELVTHGGRCCGIKTIHTFYGKPEDLIHARSATGAEKNDSIYAVSNIGKPFHWPALPVESGTARLKRFIDFVKEHRPDHLIEAVLNNYQRPSWGDTLLEHGFRCVSVHRNSNTQATIYTYHKIILSGKDVSAKDAEKFLKDGKVIRQVRLPLV